MVIGVVALLIAILMATVSRARESGRRVACLSNLRQLGMAITMYVGDARGCFPHMLLWTPWSVLPPESNTLTRYGMIPEIYRCPSDSPEQHRYPVPPAGNGYEYSYTGNFLIFAGGNYMTEHIGIRASQVIRPSEKIMVIDESPETIDDCIWAARNWFTDRHNMLSNRHDLRQERAREADPEETLKRGRGNVAFVDGHADFIPRRWAMDPYYYDPLMR